MRAVSTEVTVELSSSEAVVETVDDVVVAYVGDGCPCVEETLEVRPKASLRSFLQSRRSCRVAGRWMDP